MSIHCWLAAVATIGLCRRLPRPSSRRYIPAIDLALDALEQSRQDAAGTDFVEAIEPGRE